jgi:hypothetical protein
VGGEGVGGGEVGHDGVSFLFFVFGWLVGCLEGWCGWDCVVSGMADGREIVDGQKNSQRR